MTPGNPQDAAGVREGQILAGKYRVERVLGLGGMGVVVAAHHVQLDERVAIKFLLPAMLHNQEVVRRFAREARAAVKIKSEHVARVSDVGTLENGAPYMVMEYLEGRDLAAWIRDAGPLPVEETVDFVLQACVGVASAHGIGIVHRDLKPANLFCLRGNDGQPFIKVLDFGISKITSLSASEADGAMTHTAAVMGSPFYMSPEQMRSAKDVDTRTDIWALGVIVYELLTAVTPFAGDSYAEVAIKVATAPFVRLRSLRPDAPAGLEAVIFMCLEKDKTKRYGNVAELALALSDFGTKRSWPSVERTIGIIQAAGISTGSPSQPLARPFARTSTQPSKPTEPASERQPHEYGSLGTMAPAVGTAHSVRGRRKAFALVALAGTAAVAAWIGWAAWAKHPPSVASVVPPSLVAPEEPVVLPPLTPNTEPTESPGPASSPVRAAGLPSLTPLPSAAHADAKKSAGAKSAATTPAVAPPAAALSAQVAKDRPKPNCSPPYVIDSAGDRQYKPECL